MARAAKPADMPITFIGYLQTNRRGEIPAEADTAMTDILAALRAHGGKGKLTLALTFKLGKSGQIEILPDLKVEKPRRALSTGLYFADDEGTLTRRDPNQGDWVDDDLATRRDLDS